MRVTRDPAGSRIACTRRCQIAAELAVREPLLADRFQLKLHPEMKEVSGYVLVVPTGGPKVQRRPDKPFRTACGGGSSESLAQCLSVRLGEPVFDKTGIGASSSLFLTAEALNETDPDAPSLFTVVEEQLGLKLQRQKVPVRVLVIDNIERPTAN